MKAKDVLELKVGRMLTIEPQKGILEAIRLLSQSDQGALVVVDRQAQISGIITKRDILRAHRKSFGRMKGFTVSDLATKKLVIGLADDSVECLMATMSHQHIRHLPIMSGRELLGLLSMRDLVVAQSQLDQVKVRYLKDYISSQYPN